MSDELLHGLIDVPKTEVQLLLEAGYLYMEMGRPKEAEEVFAGVAALLPESDVPLVALGNLEFSQGRYQRALKHHQDALKLRPDSAVAQAHVGEALLRMKKTKEGLAALEKALAMDPSGPAGKFAAALKEAHDDGSLAR